MTASGRHDHGNYRARWSARPDITSTDNKNTGALLRCSCYRYRQIVTESKSGYFCESLDCRFGLWKDNRYLTAKRIDLTPDRAKTLLEEGQVMVHGMYSERTGNNYDVMLVLADNGQQMRYKLSFDYAE